jgi:hypothetical protein
MRDMYEYEYALSTAGQLELNTTHDGMLEGGYALFQHKSVDRHVEFVAEFV